jgi:hypothetical protein
MSRLPPTRPATVMLCRCIFAANPDLRDIDPDGI